MLRRLAKTLVAGATVRITGYALDNTVLARSRATSAADFLRRYAKVRVTLRLVTKTHAQTVNISTIRQ